MFSRLSTSGQVRSGLVWLSTVALSALAVLLAVAFRVLPIAQAGTCDSRLVEQNDCRRILDTDPSDCITQCNDGCPQAEFKEGTDNKYNIWGSGTDGARDTEANDWVKCYDVYPCVLWRELDRKCVISQVVPSLKYCSANHEYYYCQQCDPGTPGVDNRFDAKLTSCEE